MRAGIEITVRPEDRARLEALVHEAVIHRYIAEHNTAPKPFVWTADPDRVLAAISRAKQSMRSIH